MKIFFQRRNVSANMKNFFQGLWTKFQYRSNDLNIHVVNYHKPFEKFFRNLKGTSKSINHILSNFNVLLAYQASKLKPKKSSPSLIQELFSTINFPSCF